MMPEIDIETLFHKEERLIPILRPHIVKGGPLGEMIQHPLIQEIFYRKEMNAIINHRYRMKVENLAHAIINREWHTVIFLHERPYRLTALLNHGDEMTDKEYWSCVGHIWTDSENIWQNYNEWRAVWESPRPEKIYAMDTEERKRLKVMPKIIKVFRGIHGKGITKRRNQIGLSWTLDEEKAKWFANRWKEGKQVILTAFVDKKDVHAFFTGRAESEIVATKVKVL